MKTCAMPDWELLLTDARIATMRAPEDPGMSPCAVIERGALAVTGGRIAWVGAQDDLPVANVATRRSLDGRLVTPGLIDCHTHIVFAGSRAHEFEQRLNGASYADIAAAGGGIMSTVRATRGAPAQQLFDESAQRLRNLIREGVTTIEIKSGYGLETLTEQRMLETARRLGQEAGIGVVTTFLGAHALPADWTGTADDYVRHVCEDMLPALHELNLVDAVDAYCETVGFKPAQVQQVFARAAELGLPVRLHADQLSDTGGATLAAEANALSADHLEYTTETGVGALAAAGTVAVLLPGAFLTLREQQPPPIAALRDAGVPLALASDCNPGTSPICSLRAAMHLGAALFRLTPAECLAGVTHNAARALGLLHDRGTLEPGKRADFLIWDTHNPAELIYWLGLHAPVERYVEGSRQNNLA